MNKPGFPPFRVWAVLISAVFVLLPSVLAQIRQAPTVNIAWEPITDAERQLSAPVVDKNADLEALFAKVWVYDEIFGGELQRVRSHYVRLKVFTEKGKEKAATLEIETPNKSFVSWAAGRTVKRDGTVLELSKDAIHDRQTVKAGGIKLQAKSLAMPGVEIGAIVEYRWKEVQANPNFRYMRIQYQREYPVQTATYYFWPLPRDLVGVGMSLMSFHTQTTPVKQENNGFQSVTLSNVPAFREEPYMAAEENVRSWALVYYRDEGDPKEPEKYWPKIGKREYNDMKVALRSSAELKQAAATAVGDAADDEEKVVRLIRYIRANVRDLYGRQVSDAERLKILKQMKEQRAATEILKSGIATANEMNKLFAALAMEVRLDARPALVASRNDMNFHEKTLTDAYFLSSIDMALKTKDGQWKLYDVSARLLPPNMLAWSEESVRALITDPKNPEFITTPLSQPADSVTARKGTLTLDAEGNLEGDIEETFTGHTAYDKRKGFDGDSEAERQEEVKNGILRTFPQAEVTNIKVENADDPEKLLRVQCHIKIPGYAQRTGKRLFFQPLLFQRGIAPRFSATERQYDVFFRYAWSEKDAITIKLPSGYEFERPEAPG